MLWIISRKTSLALGPAALYISAGMLSLPNALAEFVCFMAVESSSIEGGISRSFIVGCWGTCSSAVGSTVDGLFSSVLKCSAHLFLRRSWFLISIDPSADSNEVDPGFEGP